MVFELTVVWMVKDSGTEYYPAKFETFDDAIYKLTEYTF